MANYDFRSLSPHDFELLCRDLLQARKGFAVFVPAGSRHHGGFHGLNPTALYRTIKVVIVLYLRIARFRLLEPPFPRHG